MRVLPALGAALFALMPALAAPTVVRTEPAAGAVVPAGELVITIVFSEGLKMNSHSLVAVDGVETPEVLGEPWFDNPTTFHLKVRLQAGRQYGIGFNSATRQGFLSADGERPLEPFALRFSTAGGAADGVAFRGGWREGETVERILSIERSITIDNEPLTVTERVARTVTAQPGRVEQGEYHAMRLKVTDEKVERTNLESGVVEPWPMLTPTCVFIAEEREGNWRVRCEGPEPDGWILDVIGAAAAVDNPFAPPHPVAEGDTWAATELQLRAAAELIGATGPVTGQIDCRFAERREVQGHPAAVVAHRWEVAFPYDEFRLEAKGTGESVFLLDAGKFISHRLELDLTFPPQEVEGAGTLSGRGKQTVTLRLRYLAPGSVPELQPGAAQPNAVGLPAADKTGLPFGQNGGPDEPAERAPGGPGNVAFEQAVEPREKAFTFVMPAGWLVDGGIIRFPPDAAGAHNAVDAKIDLTLKSDPAGSVMMRWLPDIYFADPNAGLAGPMFPPGSQYNGMIAMPKMTWQTYLAKLVFPQIHPQAQGARIVHELPLPELAGEYQKAAKVIAAMIDFRYACGILTVQYTEGGNEYVERMYVCLEDWGQAGAGMWRSKDTFVYRTPLAQLDAWLPVVQRVHGSVQLDPEWLRAEVREAARRQGQVIETTEQVNQIADAIAANRRATQEEIQQQMHQTLVGE